MTPTARLGRVQRQVILCLLDDEARTAARIDDDMMFSPGAADGTLRGLWKRGIVDRAFSYDKLEWGLTFKGREVAAELFPDGEEE